MSMLKRVSGATVFICLSVFANTAFADEQRNCQFDRVLTTAGEMQASNWTVILAQTGPNARVVVDGSGDYQGTVKNSGNGAAEFKFSTDVSDEIITVSPDGEAAWQINFRDKKTMAYFGICNAAKRTQ